MKSKAIGVLDSGLGGLAVCAELRNELPHEDILYCTDFLNLPYGPKPAADVRRYVEEIVNFLINQPVKGIVIACNTASVAAKDLAQSRAGQIPVIGMIEPAVQAALRNEDQQSIGVIGTAGTINSGVYEEKLQSHNRALSVRSKSCPDLLRLAEKGEIENGERISQLAQECLDPLIQEGIDSLILGCTDFTCLREYLEKNLPPQSEILDPAEEAARELRRNLEARRVLRPSDNGRGKLVLYHRGEAPAHAATFAKRVFDLTISERREETYQTS